MSVAHGLEFDWSLEALPVMQERCVSPFLASALRPPNATPHPSLHTRSDGPCPVLGCTKERGNCNRASLQVLHPSSGPISVWICKACRLTARRTPDNVSGEEQMGNMRVSSVFKVL